MPIPSLVEDPRVATGLVLLPRGCHPMTLADIRQKFVESAPFGDHRATVFAAFEIWLKRVGPYIGDARLLVDGGFVTHKPWAAPDDIDVVALVSPQQFAMLDEFQVHDLDQLRTKEPEGQPRVQPMGGLVDAAIVPTSLTPIWEDTWEEVRGPDKELVRGAKKGYVEVIRL